MNDDLPAERCNALALRQATRHVSQFYDRHLAATGLKGTQFSIVARLVRRGPSSIGDLARDLVLDRTTLGRNLRPLERDGLVVLAADPVDRRTRLLTATPAGKACYEQALPAWKAAQQAFERAFGRSQSAALRDLMRAVTRTSLEAPADPASA